MPDAPGPRPAAVDRPPRFEFEINNVSGAGAICSRSVCVPNCNRQHIQQTPERRVTTCIIDTRE